MVPALDLYESSGVILRAKFQQVLRSTTSKIQTINKKMQKWSCISQLQITFGNPDNIKIYDRKRRYKGEAKVKLITSDLLTTGLQE